MTRDTIGSIDPNALKIPARRAEEYLTRDGSSPFSAEPRQIRHSVEVAAESLYEAAALAVNEFRRHPWTDGMEPGAITRLAVSVNSPKTTHEVSIQQLERWVTSTAKSPQDTLLKGRVRELLDSK